MTPRLSIIVPVLNEAGAILPTLQRLVPLRARGHEVIVVDGGSTDATPQIVRPWVDVVAHGARGRARQQNAGAALANGEVLLFLHADTLLPENADVLVANAMRAGHVWGRFDVRIEGRPALLPLIAFCMNLRSRLTGIATGDQAIFVRAAPFQQAGQFALMPLMEDIELSARLKKIGPPACIREPVMTSGRRWEADGVLRTIWLMWSLRLRYFLGESPVRLAARYRDARRV